jgi:small subunit ribosomal protein S20
LVLFRVGFTPGHLHVARRRVTLRPTTRPEHHPPDELRGFFVANIKSQLKRIKTNEKARLRNKGVKSALKTSVRKFREAADAGERDTALEALQSASRQLDKAASKGVIHANQAANRKSAMAKRAAAL